MKIEMNDSRLVSIAQVKDFLKGSQKLEKTDEVHLRLSEGAAQEVLRREFEIFNHPQFQTISGVSHSHITNLLYNLQLSLRPGRRKRKLPGGKLSPPSTY